MEDCSGFFSSAFMFTVIFANYFIVHLSPHYLRHWAYEHLHTSFLGAGAVWNPQVSLQQNSGLHLSYLNWQQQIQCSILHSHIWFIWEKNTIFDSRKLQSDPEIDSNIFQNSIEVSTLLSRTFIYFYMCVCVYTHVFWFCKVVGRSKAEIYSWVVLILFQL